MSPNIQLADAFDGWRKHNSLPQCDTETTVGQFLRETHPRHHVTRGRPEDVDLLGYAEAGHATMKAYRDDSYDANRRYHAPSTRLNGTAGVLQDKVRFGRWDYQWQDSSFIVYQVTYYDIYSRDFKLFFVLSRSDAEPLQDGHHPATDRLLLAAGEWTQALHDEIYSFDDAAWSKDKLLFKAVQGSSWDDVILDPDMKRNLMRDVQGFFDNRAVYNRMNVPWKRGVILHGVPGNGKTISIKALINALAARRPDPVPALYVKSLDSCPGPKWSIQQIFSHARKMAPCLLIFEDLDSMVEDKTRSYFLNEVDGLESNEGILMIGSTNHLDRLDAAITKRPSRFDRKYHFRVPGAEERLAYCRYWAAKFDDAAEIGFCEELYGIVARLSDGFSFAYLKELFVTSLLAMARDDSENNDEDVDFDGTVEVPASTGSDNGSSSDGVVVETTASVDENVEADAGAKEGQESRPRPKRVMPEIGIPESLKDNKLLRVLLREAKTLWEQMDNSEEEEKKPGPAAACDSNPAAMGRMLARMATASR